jgi:hypothetical protein
MLNSSSTVHPFILLLDYTLRIFDLVYTEFEALEKPMGDPEKSTELGYKIITRIYALIFSKSFKVFSNSLYTTIIDFKYIALNLVCFGLTLYIIVFKFISYLFEPDDDEKKENKAKTE